MNRPLKSSSRPNQYFDLGVKGRKTGWAPTRQVRKDEDGLDNIEDFFHSDEEETQVFEEYPESEEDYVDEEPFESKPRVARTPIHLEEDVYSQEYDEEYEPVRTVYEPPRPVVQRTPRVYYDEQPRYSSQKQYSARKIQPTYEPEYVDDYPIYERPQQTPRFEQPPLRVQRTPQIESYPSIKRTPLERPPSRYVQPTPREQFDPEFDPERTPRSHDIRRKSVYEAPRSVRRQPNYEPEPVYEAPRSVRRQPEYEYVEPEVYPTSYEEPLSDHEPPTRQSIVRYASPNKRIRTEKVARRSLDMKQQIELENETYTLQYREEEVAEPKRRVKRVSKQITKQPRRVEPVQQVVDDSNARRSKRTRVAPLQYWKNERAVYSRRDSTGPMPLVLQNVIRVKDDPPPQPKRTVHKPTLESIPEIEYRNYETKQTEIRKLVVNPAQVDTRPSKSGEFEFRKTFMDKDYLATGTVIIPKGSRKPRKSSHDACLVFLVLSGTIDVTINEQTVRNVKAGYQITVPRGNFYSMHNHTGKDCRLFFCHAKEIRVNV